MPIPKTKREIWLNRVRVWMPPSFVLIAIASRRPEWRLWGVSLVVIGETLRTWAAGHLLKDEQLTVGGPYAHVRNPLYLGSLLSGIGFLWVMGDWVLAAIFAAAALIIYLPTVKQEEDYLRRMHGEAFDAYREAVPGIVPRLRPAGFGAAGDRGQSPALRVSRFEWRWVWLNKEHKTWVALLAVLGLMAARTWWDR
jgi:protein-S-isoprenylcysteine O-methyltransferase Ste14